MSHDWIQIFTMPTPRVRVSVTFVSAQKGCKPTPFIEEPIDLTDYIGDFKLSEFSRLKKQ